MICYLRRVTFKNSLSFFGASSLILVAISVPILKTGSKFKSKNKISIQVAKIRKFIWVG